MKPENKGFKDFLLSLYRTTKDTNAKTGKVSFELLGYPGYEFSIICKKLKVKK